MDLEYSAAEQSFRDDIRTFIGQNLSKDVAAKVLGHKRLSREDIIGWHRILHTRGWSGPTWPKEFGGPGWTAVSSTSSTRSARPRARRRSSRSACAWSRPSS